MDVRYFLQNRLDFIRQLYATTTAPYFERMRKIEAEEEPFVPEFDDSGEPAFQSEWKEADDSVEELGRMSVSMLASTLQLYFKTWSHLLNVQLDEAQKKIFRDRGWLHGYKALFAHNAGIPFDECPISLGLLEEIILLRNRAQHPEWLGMNALTYSDNDLRKLTSPVFVDEYVSQSSHENAGQTWFLSPFIKITPEKLEASISAVERFAHWMETVDPCSR